MRIFGAMMTRVGVDASIVIYSFVILYEYQVRRATSLTHANQLANACPRLFLSLNQWKYNNSNYYTTIEMLPTQRHAANSSVIYSSDRAMLYYSLQLFSFTKVVNVNPFYS